jgi:purine-binding chemotaxis protein CheW
LSARTQVEEILIFELAGGRYGLASQSVREVVRAASLVKLPSAPSVVEGALNVRGDVAAIVDVRARLGLPPKPMEVSDHFILAWDGTRLVGLRVDRAVGLVPLGPGDLASADAFLARPGLVRGVAKLADGLLVIHDLERFLNADEQAAVDQSLSKLSSSPEAR